MFLIEDHIQDIIDAKKSNLQDCRITASKHPWNVTCSTHAKARAFQRHGHKDSIDWQDFHRKVVRAVEKHGADGEYHVTSLSHGHSAAVDVDQKNRTMHIMSILGQHHKHAIKHSDIKIQSESVIWSI